MKKKVLCLTLALLLMLSVVACGNGGDKESTAPPESSAPAEPPTQATEPPETTAPTESEKPGEDENSKIMVENMNQLLSDGKATITLRFGDGSTYDTFTVDERHANWIAQTMAGYTWEKMENPPDEPFDYQFFVASGDGTKRMTFCQYDVWGAVKYTDGQSTTYWTATTENTAKGSVAYGIWFEYVNFEAGRPIVFQIDGDAEAAAEYFATRAYGEHLESYAPGGPNSIHEYEAADWEAEEISEDGTVVTGHVNYTFVPDVISDNALWWIPNTSEYGEGRYIAYRTFILQKQADGCWHCMGTGTGNFYVTDVQP